MINGEIVLITKGHISDYLYQYGIIVKENVDSLKIIDMFPPLPKNDQFSNIFSVNGSCPLKNENWHQRSNLVLTEKGEYNLILLTEKRKNRIANTRSISFLDFKNFSVSPKELTPFKSRLIIDFRYNYGGATFLISQYQNFFTEFLQQNEKNKIICIAGHSTASSAELLLEKLVLHPRVFVIGTETYRKQFAYKIIEKEEKLVMIPFKKLSLTVKSDKSFPVSDYYNFQFKDGKRYFVAPKIISLKF